MLTKKTSPFHNAAKAFAHCEICIEEVQRAKIPPWAYEFFYNSFIWAINQAWEFSEKGFELLNCDSVIGRELIKKVSLLRARESQFLKYVREARNQLAHRESIIWLSDEEPNAPEGIGATISLSDSYYATNRHRYSCVVLPSMSCNFSGTQIAVKPVYDKKGNIIPVPKTLENTEIDNSPLGIMRASYEYYGENFKALVGSVN
ncbi:hypothetical protein ACQ5ES_07405 [Pseudidiomarina sp. E22-M8]|uniref:hypothetical protein n=1 Tax=Pseudidiomarina sp. E22-M8 TaxID=3424768 RepID=UPI00403C894A